MIDYLEETNERFSDQIFEYGNIYFESILEKAQKKWNNQDIQITDLDIEFHTEDVTKCSCCSFHREYEYYLIITLSEEYLKEMKNEENP
jgi:hypothetical protein